MAFRFDEPGVKFDEGRQFDEPASNVPQPLKPMAKPKLNLHALDGDQTVGLTLQIKTAMTGNAAFPTPNPSLTVLGTMAASTQAKIAAANTAVAAAQLALRDRDLSIEALRGALRQEAAYVENASGGDAMKIESAGMSIRSAASPIGLLAMVSNLFVSAGDDEGVLEIGWDPVRGKKSYQIQYCVDPISANGWKDVAPTSKSRKTLRGLTSGTRVWVRVRAIASREEDHGPWSDPGVKTVP